MPETWSRSGGKVSGARDVAAGGESMYGRKNLVVLEILFFGNKKNENFTKNFQVLSLVDIWFVV